MKTRLCRLAWLVIALLVCLPADGAAQYFGRNKVQYRTFDFQILRTEHFDLYYYPEEAEATQIISRLAERWHARLSRFFGHDLRGRQVVILYAVGSHFRQTNAIEGIIGEATGGVTEGLRRRIVLPISGTLADTDHVLGHELVHAFQFDLTGEDPRESTGQASGIMAFPLWFVEGMAEYLSLGPIDAQTTMWLRDAAIREKLPHIRDLDSYQYFPYRWGHAFWAYVGAKYGDRQVASLVRSAANPRFDLAGLTRQLGTDPDTFTEEWHNAIIEATSAVTDALSPVASAPTLIVGPERGGGRYNVGPRVSPDGKQVVFFSEKDRFSVDLYLADADTGKVLRKLATSSTDPHFDSLQFLNSAGAWSPDGRQLAVTAVHGGRPVVAILDVRNGRIRRELTLKTLDDALNPTFTPDGLSIVLSGNRGGLVDLYRVTIATGAVEQLTSDPFADLEPAVTPDGKSVVFVSERFSTDLEQLEPGPLRLARLDLATKAVTPIVAFARGKHLSPAVSADGRTVTFVADPDGVSNLYRIAIDGGPVDQLSSVTTGIAGITTTSPAASLSASTGRLVYSVFEDNGYSIYSMDPKETVVLVPSVATSAAALLPGRTTPGGDVQALLTNTTRGLPPAGSAGPTEVYRQKLKLDFLGQPTISGSFDRVTGAHIGGSISAFFSDMLGDRGLGFQAQAGGSLSDFGGEIVYINRQHRWNWAAAMSVLPTTMSEATAVRDYAANTMIAREVLYRQTGIGPTITTAFPFNPATRLQVSAAAERLTFNTETTTVVTNYDTGRLISREREQEQAARPLNLAHSSVAIVHDTSLYGATSPFFGARSRIEVGQTVGTLRYSTLLLDWRRYFMPVRPWTIAVRGLHYGRYGRSAEDSQLLDLYVGYPEFVHGYGVNSYTLYECSRGVANVQCAVSDNLKGSRIAVANIEVHVPIPGVFSGEFAYSRVPVDLVFFSDAGIAWSSTDRPSFAGGSHELVRSVGGAVRVNVYGLLTAEVAVSRPLDRPDRSLQIQFGIRQGF